MIRTLAVLALITIPVASALAQQQASPEIQAASQMLQQSQAQEFSLRVEVAKLRGEIERLKATAVKPAPKPADDSKPADDDKKP